MPTRRQKQRLENPARAERMHIARIEHEQDLDWLIPQDSNAREFNIGCSGWFYWDWKEKFYPQDIPTSKWFAYYAERFKTVEINASFYSWPTVATVKSWARQAKAQDFVYAVKVSELITHSRKFKQTKELISDFGYIADLLGPHMGCFLFQCPPSFDYSLERLESITTQLDPRRRNVVEFRHASWWNETVYDALREHGIIFCSCSGPKLPDDLIKTADDIYIRFHGIEDWYRYDYSDHELAAWAQKIEASGAKRVWAYFNNDYDAYAVKNARTLSNLLQDS